LYSFFTFTTAIGDQTVNFLSVLTLAILPIEAALPIKISSFSMINFFENCSNCSSSIYRHLSKEISPLTIPSIDRKGIPSSNQTGVS
jgi:hypothetical protein